MKKTKQSIKSKKKIKIKKESNIKNIVYIIISISLILIIFLISLKISKKEDYFSNELFFSISDFEYITPIGLNEYLASLNYDETSIIFFCDNETKDCHDSVEHLNNIAKEYNLNIEFLNIVELTASEKKQLIDSSNYFSEEYYPKLMIIKNKEFKYVHSEYFTEKEMIDVFKNNKIIK